MAYFNLEARSQQLNAEISSKFQGTAKISLDRLLFDQGESNPKKTNRLVEIFKREGCDRLKDSHAISGTIAADLLSASLQQSNLSMADLRGPEPPTLRLPTGMHVRCFHGKHRVEALRELKHFSPWWTVKLYVDLSPKAAQVLAEDFANEGQFSDGHIVMKICSYPPDSIDARRWWSRLSKSKPEILRRLLKHTQLGPALGVVLQIPGLRPGLQLAIWKKIMAENAVEEVVHYLKLIYDTWCYIMGSTAALEFVDSDAVQELELRAPGISNCDGLYASTVIQTNTIFQGVADKREREKILQRLQHINYLIPTIHTLQQDFKYLRQCTSVMKQLILGKSRLPITVQTIVSSAYNTDATAGHAETFEKNMKLLYLTIMQNLVELSGEDPLREDDEQAPKTRPYDQRAWHQLALRARELGFDSDEISRLSRLDSDREMAKRALLDARPLQHYEYGENLDTLIATIVQCFNEARPIMPKDTRLALTTSYRGEPIKRRCGRQYSKAYFNDRLYMNLDNFTSTIQKDADITSLFVRRSVFHAFWGGHNKQDTNQSSVNNQSTGAQHEQMSDMDTDSSQSGDAQDQQMSDVDGADQEAGNSNNTSDISMATPAKDYKTRDRPASTRPILILRRESRRGIRIRRRNERAKLKSVSQKALPADRDSTLTTFISAPPGHEPQNTSQPKLLQDNRTMTILIRRNGEWEDIKECPRSLIIDAIAEVRRENSGQEWFLFNTDGRGISLEDCPTFEDNIICLNTDASGFPAGIIT